jgi:hypothetical protein
LGKEGRSYWDASGRSYRCWNIEVNINVINRNRYICIPCLSAICIYCTQVDYWILNWGTLRDFQYLPLIWRLVHLTISPTTQQIREHNHSEYRTNLILN